MNFCGLNRGDETLGEPFGLFLAMLQGDGHCIALRCPDAVCRDEVPLEHRCPKPSQATPSGEGLLWKGVAVNPVPATTCRATDAAGARRCRRDSSAFAVSAPGGLCPGLALSGLQ